MFAPTETRAETKFTIDAALSHIDVSVDATFPRVSDAQLKGWVQNAADAVVAYYGRYQFPTSSSRSDRSMARASGAAARFPCVAA